MSGLDLDALLASALDAAAVGAEVVRNGFGTARNVSAKGPGDWVSEIDVASEAAVRAVLTGAWPELAFFGEEGGGDRAEVGWYVDPLDGTTNFLHGLPSVGVAIALVEGGRPVVGVVAAPLLGEVYAARLGGGATRNGVAIRVGDRRPEEALCATGFPFRHQHRLEPFLATFEAALRSVEDIRRVGAASMDLCWTGSGVFDGYFELSLGTWDVAAGGLIVREAGGVVTDWWGDEERWLWSGDVVAGSPVMHEHLVEITSHFTG